VVLMARKKAATRRRRKFTGVNVPAAIIGYAGATIWSEAILGVSPLEFFLSDKTVAKPSGAIVLRELIGGGSGGVHPTTASKLGIARSAMGMMQYKFQQNWMDAAIKSVALSAGSAVGLKLTKKPRAFLTRTAKNFGLGDLIRF